VHRPLLSGVVLFMLTCVRPILLLDASEEQECISTLRGTVCEPALPKRSSAPGPEAHERARSRHDHDSDAASRAASFLHQGLTVVDWDARVFMVPHFLSDTEADTLIELGHDALTEQYAEEWKSRHAYSTIFFSREQYRRNEILRQFEERVARLTMVKGHNDEAPAMFTRQIPGTSAGSYIPNQVLRNVHHDKNMRENRVVTVLVYLSTANDGDGGHTLFPCLPARDAKAKARRVARDFARDFSRLFDNGTRVIDEKSTSAAEVDLLRRANAECLKPQSSKVLSIRPKKGTAIVFWNVEADGHPNHNVWHAACQALKGGHRYALQKFKELPRVSGEWVLEGGAAKPKWKNKDEL
jgi:hypothetical protein